MKLVVDRIENNIAVCIYQDEKVINIDLKDIKGEISENDVIIKVGKKWIKSNKDTDERKKYIESLTENMWKN